MLATLTNVARNASISLTNLIVAILSAVVLLSLPQLLVPGSLIDLKLALSSLVEVSSEAIVALKVIRSALTRLSSGGPLELFTVKALVHLLAAHVADGLPEETFLGAVAAIIWRPQLEVGVGHTGFGFTYALGQEQAAEINKGEKCFGFFSAIVCFEKGSVHQELLRDRLGLNYDVLNDDVLVGDLETIPGHTLVKRKLDFHSRGGLASNNYQGTVVADLINPATLLSDFPTHATISRNIKRLFHIISAEIFTRIACSEYESDR